MDDLFQAPVHGGPKVFARDGAVFADSRDVAEFFGKRHADVLRDIRNLLKNLPSSAGCNFAPNVINDLKGESWANCDMTRDGFVLLAMGFTGQKAIAFKLRYIEEFNRMEATLRTATPSALMTREQQIAQALLLSQDVIREKDERIAELAPKARALERIAMSRGAVSITAAAKVLQIQPDDLFNLLHEKKWIYRSGGDWTAYQERIQSGYLEVKIVSLGQDRYGNSRSTTQARVTPKGIARLGQLLSQGMAAAA